MAWVNYFKLRRKNIRRREAGIKTCYVPNKRRSSSREVEEAVSLYRKLLRLNKIDNVLAGVDRSELEQRVLSVGGKGAYLELSTRVLDALRTYDHRLEVVSVPDFTSIPVDVYRDFVAGRDISEALRPFYNWIAGRSVMVRSSCLYSEDSDERTGAGIYLSEKLDAAAGFDGFRKSVENVYRSVDSEDALIYRARYGIEKEEMAIVLQEHVGVRGTTRSYMATLNSTIQGIPELAEIVVEGGVSPILRWDRVEDYVLLRTSESLGTDSSERWSSGRLYHINNDASKFADDSGEVPAVLAYYLERFYRCPVQMEYALSICYVDLFQTRKLPVFPDVDGEVEFPHGMASIFSGKAVGKGDMELEVLSSQADIPSQRGVVIVADAHGGLINKAMFECYIPKEGAVILLTQSVEGKGHIETRCRERGIICLVSDKETDRAIENQVLGLKINDLRNGQATSLAASSYHGRRLGVDVLDHLDGHRKLRIVANGLEGRAYSTTAQNT